MFKVMIFAKRKPGLDRVGLIALYENAHIPMTNDLVGKGRIPPLHDYRRNYLVHDSPLNIGPALDFDVVTEATFADRAAFEANREALAEPDLAKLIGEDMAEMLDLATLRYVVVDEYRGGGEASAV